MHPLFKSVLFTQGVADRLGHRVGLSFPNDGVTPTGIPPHVSIQRQQ